MQNSRLHTFHIPVMGLAFTIDTPVKVARYGISSVISIVEDKLVEMMRRHYYPVLRKEYYPISTQEPDYRAKRITDYLNLVNAIVQEQINKLRQSAFTTGSEIVKYFDMLPEDNSLKQLYRQMMGTIDKEEKEELECYLRSQIQPGSIDVNIMTKVDRETHQKNGEIISDGSDAVTALRGFAQSDLNNAGVVFSAGLNPRLYNYLSTCEAFAADENGRFVKRVIVKVSDYRSALIQGKYLAKKGVWVSEFRIESGLNCGGHAFATDGYLLGPILEEFKTNRQELIESLFTLYNTTRKKENKQPLGKPPILSVSVQGGIGTYEEDGYLRQHFDIDKTGWGTPFLLVPEATTVDAETLQLLSAATEDDMVLSQNSPLGVRFHYLKGTSSDREKQSRIQAAKPGSPCTEKHLAFNTEFTKEPICTASRKYQELKIKHLQSLNLAEDDYKKREKEVFAKECLCVGLSNSAALNYDQVLVKKLDAVAICPGPNIVHFSKIVSLQTMTNHIYGRENLLSNKQRPHMFVAELYLYIDFLKEKMEDDREKGCFEKNKKYYSNFYQNLRDGIQYYTELPHIAEEHREPLLKDLSRAGLELDGLCYQNGFLEKYG